MPVIIAVARYRNACGINTKCSDQTLTAASEAGCTAVAPAATTRQNASATTEQTTLAASLAIITRAREGTSVNVVSAVRCENSPVTSSTPISGSRIAVGSSVTENTWRNVCPESAPAKAAISATATATRATQIGSQKPDRVS